jgi:carbon monoxide dehydrogenase subunit G
MKVERTIEIACTPEEVYEAVMDPQRLDDWVTIHAGLKNAPSGELKQGSELTQSLKLAGRRFDVHWEVVQDDCPNRVVWEGRGPAHSKAKVVYDFDGNGDATTFSYMNEYTLPGGALGRLAGRAFGHTAGREADRSLERLKALCEQSET